ncbi:MAG: TetR-like C-terminal domain-containing protein [Paracoccaceae bacterium]
MTPKAQKRKAELAEKLMHAAEQQIIMSGLRSVKARDLARQVGCSVGAIYNVYDDLNALVMAVNGRTFSQIDVVVTASLTGNQGRGPNERLILMSNAYLSFAADNTNLWRALFDLDMSSDGPVPEWYLAALAGLFANIAKPLSELFPDMQPAELDLMTRGLFSSVHGIVLLGLENRISGVGRDAIETMITQLLMQIGNEKK